jgi:hypothetical protein
MNQSKKNYLFIIKIYLNTLKNYPSELFLLDVDMNDSNFTQGEMVQGYFGLVHFEGLIMN